MPRKLTRKSLVKKLDSLVSLIVRKRHLACVVCGSTERLQAGHVFSRRHYATRWNLDNVFTQCASCNINHNQNPWPYLKWFITKFGQEKLDELEGLYHQTTMWKDYELQELYDILVKSPH